MKATVNIATREVVLKYSIDHSKWLPLTQQERNERFKDWSTYQKHLNSKVRCKHTITFKNLDEWQSVMLFDGRIIDFQYQYEERKNFNSKAEWISFLFAGYEYVEGEPQLYRDNVVDKVIVTY